MLFCAALKLWFVFFKGTGFAGCYCQHYCFLWQWDCNAEGHLPGSSCSLQQQLHYPERTQLLSEQPFCSGSHCWGWVLCLCWLPHSLLILCSVSSTIACFLIKLPVQLGLVWMLALVYLKHVFNASEEFWTEDQLLSFLFSSQFSWLEGIPCFRGHWADIFKTVFKFKANVAEEQCTTSNLVMCVLIFSYNTTAFYCFVLCLSCQAEANNNCWWSL